MIVKINFTEPFRGIGYADYDRSSPCKFYGDGGRYYEMRLPLKGCGTKQVMIITSHSLSLPFKMFEIDTIDIINRYFFFYFLPKNKTGSTKNIHQQYYT